MALRNKGLILGLCGLGVVWGAAAGAYFGVYRPQQKRIESRLSAIRSAASPEMRPTPEARSVPAPESFPLDLKGQLDRIDSLEVPMRSLVRASAQPAWSGSIDNIFGNPIISLRSEGILSWLNMTVVRASPTFAEISKTDRYAGISYRVTGRILQITESNDGGVTTARVSLDEYGRQSFFVVGRFSSRFVEDDQIEVIGYLAKKHTYRSSAGWDVTVPALAAAAMIPAGATRKSLAYVGKAIKPAERVLLYKLAELIDQDRR